MSTASWRAILTATAKREGMTLAEWLADCDQAAATASATVPDYLREPKRKPQP